MRSIELQLAVLLMVAALLLACSNGADLPWTFAPGGPEPGQSSAVCATDQDCEAGQPCVDGVCTIKTCTTDEECAENQKCQDGTCIDVTTQGCEGDDQCEEGKICEENECITGCRNDGQCETGQICNTETHVCQVPLPENACEVDFAATLELRADAPNNTSDIPPLCSDPAYANPPHTDLVCCTAANFNNPGTTELGDLSCDAVDHLAITHWRSTQPMKLKFDLSNGCTVFLESAGFPEFRLENSGLDAALIIDAGATSTDSRLRGQVAASPCHEGSNGIEIEGLPLQFMVRLYENFTKCELGLSDCDGTDSFTRWFSSTPSDPDASSIPPPPDSIQILPGLDNDSFLLQTGSDSASPASGISDVATIATNGAPIHFNATSGKTEVALAVAFRMPPENTDPSLGAGTGLLTGPLANAVMAAHIFASRDGSITTLDELRAQCQTGGGGGQNLSLTASITTPLEGAPPLTEDLPVSGDATSGLTVTGCLAGSIENGDCIPFSTQDLPFAKEEGDPQFPTTASRFEKDATITLTIGEGSNVTLNLAVPDQVGPFQILNAATLNGFTLNAQDNINSDIILQVRFLPQLASGCSTIADGTVRCGSDIVISDTPRIAIHLTGSARPPAPAIKLEEIGLVPPYSPLSLLVPHRSSTSSVDFGERIIDVQTTTKLFRISNSGVRPMEVTNIESEDRHLNFRVGSIFQGESFALEDRVWRASAAGLSVTPDGENDLFASISYGPFATLPVAVDPATGESIRHDSSLFQVEATGLDATFVPLTGTAKLDRRATLGLYIQDDNRAEATGQICTTSCPEGVVAITDEGTSAVHHFYRATSQQFSFRQDGSDRAVYLRNDADPGLENLRIEAQPILTLEGPNVDKFVIDWEDGEEGESNVTYPRTLTSTDEDKQVKIAILHFDVDATATEYRVYDGCFAVSAASVTTSGSTSHPKIGGGETASPCGSGIEIDYSLKGANGAPDETRDLVIHRMLSGMDSIISASNQSTLIASTTTQGVMDRLGTADSDYLEKFTLADGIILDAEKGTATLKAVFTDVDNTAPVAPTSSGFHGIRLFNGPGSNPVKKEYRYQCESAATHECGYFYIYIANWDAIHADGADVIPTGPGCVGGKAAIAAIPAATSDGVLTNVLNPQDGGEADCMQDFLESTGAARGAYDPVTGEITFSNLAVRLFSPDTPGFSHKDIDSVIQVALTTECVTAGLVPDVADALPNRLVPDSTTNDHFFDAFLMMNNGPNPITLYTGTPCSEPRALHGRRMQLTNATNDIVNLDLTGTFDTGTGPAVGPLNFDLAGVGKIASTFTQGQKMMYIVIKAEIR